MSLARSTPKQSSDYTKQLPKVIERHLEARGWSPARLAHESGQSKATISRMLSYDVRGRKKPYRPSPKTVQAVALAFQLKHEEHRELFLAAFPEWEVWEQASIRGCSVIEADIMLHDKGLPLLTE